MMAYEEVTNIPELYHSAFILHPLILSLYADISLSKGCLTRMKLKKLLEICSNSLEDLGAILNMVL